MSARPSIAGTRNKAGMEKIDRALRSHLKLRHLQFLIVLDDLRHMGKAARTLGMTQSAASKALAEIEAAVGFGLFSRSVHGTRPTDYGERVILFARSVIADFQHTRDDLAALASGATGRVSVGTMGVATPILLSRSLRLLKSRSPGTTVFVDEGFLDGLLPRLRSGEFDFVLSRLEPRWIAPDLHGEALYEEPIAIVSAPSHALARKRKITWHELSREPWLVPRSGSPVRMKFDLTFMERGLDVPGNLIETTSLLGILCFVRERPAVALLTHSVARYFENAGMLKILPVAFPQPLSPVGIIALRGRRFSSGAELLIDSVRQVARLIVRDQA